MQYYLILISLCSHNEFHSWRVGACLFYFHVHRSLSADLCVCSPCGPGVCELQLLRKVHLLQLLGDAPPGSGLQPVWCQRLTHQVKSHQLPRVSETPATLCPLPHEHGHACFQLPRYSGLCGKQMFGMHLAALVV